MNDFINERKWTICSFNEIEDLVGKNEYLLYIDVADKIEKSKCYVHILEQETSQYFRKVLAKHIGYCKDYSYKTNSLLNITEQGVQKYRRELQ